MLFNPLTTINIKTQDGKDCITNVSNRKNLPTLNINILVFTWDQIAKSGDCGKYLEYK